MLNYFKQVKRETWFAFLVVFLAINIGYFFTIPPLEIGVIWPAIGFMFAFALKYGKKIFPALFIASLLARIINAFTYDLSIFTILIHPLIITTHTLIIIYLATLIANRLKMTPKLTIINSIYFTVLALAIALSQAVLGSFTYYLFFDFTLRETLSSISVWMIGDFYGLIIFGVPLYNSLLLDKDPLIAKPKKETIYLFLGFILFSFLFFNNFFSHIRFDEHKYIFMGFFVLIAFRYKYQTAYIMSFLILIFMVFYPPYFGNISNIQYVIDINTFLITNILIVLVLKHFLREINESEKIILQKSQRLDKLINATQSLFALSSDLDTLEQGSIHKQLEKMFRMIFDLFEKADYGSVSLLTDTAYYIDCIGFDKDHLNTLKMPTDNWIYSLSGPNIIKDTESLIKADLKDMYPLYAENNPKVKESIYLSLRLSETVICDMSFDLKVGSAYSFNDSDLQYFSSLQKLIESYYTSQKVLIEYDEIKDDIVLSLLRTLELFDPYTKGHSLDVAHFSRAIGQAYKLDQLTQTDLYWAAILHDVGKLGLDGDIIRKLDTLTINEYEEIKKHTVLGYEVLRESSELQRISELVKYHHEAIDGSGYPDGISGDLIPFGSKILHVAEVVASMGRTQSYSKQKSKAEIISVLRKQSNVQLDSEIAQTAIELIRNGFIDHYYE
ncbi:HD domain-containing phosphohydrolase [Liberiplasma polymorphum]|uniref:HD domain-containing phosphohydrolase n=1 Tax=Liberiplasma polymorphum TaxID=3374570 RepID=UPI003776734E